tara:strand:- start:967 stop:1296 length:330 start_codon:yes stop_codon:yes gene_type:complete
MSIQTFHNTLEHFYELTEEVQSLVTTQPDACPHCLATEYLERNSTALTSELFQAARVDPEAAWGALRFVMALQTATDVALQETVDQFLNLFQEELNGLDKSEINGATST